MGTTEQYVEIRNSITSNLSAIKTLLAQADSLHQIIAELDDTVQDDEKRKLEDAVDNIYKSIDLLIQQTDTLFKTFISFAKSKEVLVS